MKLRERVVTIEVKALKRRLSGNYIDLQRLDYREKGSQMLQCHNYTMT